MRPLSLPGSLLFAAAAASALVGCGRDEMLPLGQSLGTDAGTDAGDGGVLDGDLADVPITDAPSGDGPVVVDVGFPDTGIPDFGVFDGGVPETGVPDTGILDADVPDFGFIDTGVPDTGVDGGIFPPDADVPDIGFPDTGNLDTGVPDTGVPDTGVPDANIPDTGVPDSGVPCPLGCAFLDDVCNVGVCAPDGVTCVRAPRPNGTACDDGDLCTVGSECRFGVCAGATPVDCSAADDDCNVGVCAPTTGQCVPQPVPDGTACDDNTACTTSSCQMGACVGVPEPPPPGDTCLTPLPINITPGAQSQTGNNECAQDANSGSCVAVTGGADLIYTANFAETRRIRLQTVEPMSGAGYDTVIYATPGVCGPSPTPTAPLCDDDGGAGTFSLIDDVFFGGTWYFTVDAFAASQRGDYELLVDVDPHDTCADPSVITIPALGQTDTYFGNTSGNANDYEATCAGNARSPDQVYRFDVSTRTSLRFETVQPASGRYDTALHVRSSSCAVAAAEIACDDDAGSGTLSLIERTYDPGTYYLIVDGWSGNASGEYALEVTNLPPAVPLTFPATGDARQPRV